MISTPFRKGAVVGALSILVLEALVLMAVVAVWTVASRDEAPDPTATRQPARGTVTETGPRLCVEGPDTAEDGTVPRMWCGIAEGGVAAGLEVGDAVEGQIIDVELDPGSGAAFSFWESVTATAKGATP